MRLLTRLAVMARAFGWAMAARAALRLPDRLALAQACAGRAFADLCTSQQARLTDTDQPARSAP